MASIKLDNSIVFLLPILSITIPANIANIPAAKGFSETIHEPVLSIFLLRELFKYFAHHQSN